MSSNGKRTPLAISSKEGLHAGKCLQRCWMGWRSKSEERIVTPKSQASTTPGLEPRTPTCPPATGTAVSELCLCLNRNPEAPTHPGARPTSPIWLKPEVACLKFPDPRTTSVRDTAGGDKTGSAFLLPSSGLQCLSLVKLTYACWHRVWEMHFSVPSLARYAC